MKKVVLTLLSLLMIGFSGKAQLFFDTSETDNLLSFGARIGFNTSNRSFPAGNYTNKILTTTWGLGFDAGAVANINFKDFISLQPGFFFETQGSSMVNFADNIGVNNEEIYVAKDSRNSYKFTIPVRAIVRFNVSEFVKWNVELGPYFQFTLKENGGQNDVKLFHWLAPTEPYVAQHRGYDIGLKIGSGLNIYDHYYVGIHYMAGFCNAWSLPSGGHNKSWVFTVGYDF